MSQQQNPTQECSVLHGLEMFSGQTVPKQDSNANDDHKSTNNSTQVEAAKHVGSSRFVCSKNLIFFIIFSHFFLC